MHPFSVAEQAHKSPKKPGSSEIRKPAGFYESSTTKTRMKK
jgi:hypothetical protein